MDNFINLVKYYLYQQWCKGCLVTDTQVDGSLWGWEDKSPCEIKPYECNGK